jgi:DNA-binding transcriptional LysR family regulator
MSVKLRELRWAIVAAQHRSLRQAAEMRNIRQSTLSRGLRGLEEKLGAVLFERTNGGTRPTIADLAIRACRGGRAGLLLASEGGSYFVGSTLNMNGGDVMV